MGSDISFVWLPSLCACTRLSSSPSSPVSSAMVSTENRPLLSEEGKGIREKYSDCKYSSLQASESPESQCHSKTPAEIDYVCPICLGTIEESKGVALWWCMHKFCKDCIEEWSNVRRSCPLCKAEFTGWYQDGKGKEERTGRRLPPLEYRPSLDYRSSLSEEYQQSVSDYRISISDYRQSLSDYRLSMSAHRASSLEYRWSSANGNTGRWSSSSGRSERECLRSTMTFRSRLRLQQLLQSRSLSRSYRRSIPLPRQRSFESSERDMADGGTAAERALRWRSSIYAKGLKAVALHNRKRSEVQSDPDAKGRMEQRLQPWIHRELKAILGDDDHSLLEHLILGLWVASRSCLSLARNASKGMSEVEQRKTRTCELTGAETKSRPQSNIQGSRIKELEIFLGDKALAFWHELKCFAESPYTMTTYDSIVVYVKGQQDSGRTHGEQSCSRSQQAPTYQQYA